MDIPATAASIMAAVQDQRLDFRTIKTKPMLVKQMRKRKMKHFGHIIRHNSLGKTIIQWITAGKRGRGRPARTWERDIEEWARSNIGESTRMAERRDLWCTVIDVTADQP